MRLTQNKKVSFDPFSHTYLCGNKVLMGVTSLMKKHGLSADYGEVNPYTLAAAAKRGSAVHEALENYDNGKPVVIQDVIYSCIDNLTGEVVNKVVLTADELQANLEAYKKLNLEVVASEFLISDNKTVASSIDKILFTQGDDRRTYVDLGDVKTTSTLHKGALEWQLGIYKYLLEKQCKSVKVRNCYGIHVRKGEAKVVPINPVPASKVEALLAAEAEGRLYSEEAATAEAMFLAPVSDNELAMLASAEGTLARLDAERKLIEAEAKEIKDRLYAHMIENNIEELPVEGGMFKLKRPYQSSRVDSKKLKADYPEVADKVMVVSEVKGSISFKPAE